MFDEIIDYIRDGFDELFNIDFGGSEILSNPKFWISSLVSCGMITFVLNNWKGKVAGLTGYYIIGFAAALLFGYYLTARDLDKNG